MAMNDKPGARLDLEAVRAQMENGGGPRYWQSLAQLAGAKEVQDYSDH